MPVKVKAEVDRIASQADAHGGFLPVLYRTTNVTEADADDIAGALADIDRRLAPSKVSQVQALLGWLSDRVAWPSHMADPETAGRNAEMLAEDLAELPLECVTRIVRVYPKRNRWWPSALAELYEPAEQDRQGMALLRTRLKALHGVAEAGGIERRTVGAVIFHDPSAAERRRQYRQPTADERAEGAQKLSDVVAKLRAEDSEEAGK
ncbi:MAG: hypothetical protein U5L06_00860 [Rhodovibrio sp.]|nr:hypothetical protein [Rhodovibrio sp.]